VEFQRAGEGRALDDVVVHSHDNNGVRFVLEIQAKREITFAPKDDVFEKVVGQIAKAAKRDDFWTTRYELAIATAKMSLKIAGSYQDLLRRARDVESAVLFMERLDRPGAATDDMRTFVDTFRKHLETAGAPQDDETVWRLLRRIQILVFDFTAPGSADELLAHERGLRVLPPDEATRAGTLWTTLVQRALQLAATGGADGAASLTQFLQGQGFKLAGQRRYEAARTLLAEATAAALADIKDAVAGVSLTRLDRIDQIRTALETSRYVEVRGDAGVGKSGLLKHFARVVGIEGVAVVLSPGRTIPRGWTAMRAALGFDGAAVDLLSDLMSTGARTVFIDNLDLFDDEERRTVVDIVRAAASVPGLSVLVTARRSFGVEDASWVPAEAMAELGGATAVSVDDLTASEISELGHAAPRLAPLLADGHPARQVARNLYRLSRIAQVASSAVAPRTEVEMMDEWWRSADGFADGRRDRARVLRGAAEHTIATFTPFSVAGYPAPAVDALVKSETLRDLGNDRATFRHDVLAEWAIASLLLSDGASFERLALDVPANARLARGVELAARSVLESGADTSKWRSLLEQVSGPNAHGSWRRAVLLAVVRSEAAAQLLAKTAESLVANEGLLLRELIGTVCAVEVIPISQLLGGLGVEGARLQAHIPPHLNAPAGSSWMRLLKWLIPQRDTLPAAVVPDVADLYWDWSVGMFGADALTPLLLRAIYDWLVDIEAASDLPPPRTTRFDKGLGGRNFTDVASGLRSYLVLFGHRAPALAAAYLKAVRQRPHNDRVVSELLKQSGQLPKAAPAELAELTAAALIEPRRRRRHGHDRLLDDGFTFVDHEFLPPSPAQGPFLELLRNSPRDGLALVRKLVDHAIAVVTDQKPPGSNGFLIPFSEGDRFFPWARSYGWSRGGSRSYAVVSALMALEAWAHERLDNGEPLAPVLSDVLGEPGAPAAYLLVAVDLLLSHWPASRAEAMPFLGCPELLCIERERQLNDAHEPPDIFGLGELRREPKGGATLASLKKRYSRSVPLEALLPNYALAAAENERRILSTALLRARERLGPYDEAATFGDPPLMVAYAINLVDPANYLEERIQQPDGTAVAGYRYIPPEAERKHIERLQHAQTDRTSNFAMQLSILNALETATKPSSEFVVTAVEWAQAPAPADSDDDQETALEMREQAVLTAALLAMRDGTSDLRQTQSEWAEKLFAATVHNQDDPVYRFRSGLRYNPVAIAFVGRAYALSPRPTIEEITKLLEMTSQAAVAHGFRKVAAHLNELDPRLPRALLRCALTSSVRQRRRWDLGEDETDLRTQAEAGRRARAIAGEIDWLFGGAPEPPWPDLPLEKPAKKPRIRIVSEGNSGDDDPPSATFFDDQCGAMWISGVRELAPGEETQWVVVMLEALALWTWRANGSGLRADEEPSERSHEWNDAYFDLMAYRLLDRHAEDLESFAVAPLCALPEERFLDVTTTFLRAVDDVYFNDRGLSDEIAVTLRAQLAQHLRTTRSWRRMAGNPSTSIEIHLGPAVATLFFNFAPGFEPPKPYLYAAGVKRLAPFLPVLEALAIDGPSYHVADVMLNLFTVAPEAEHIPVLIRAASAWYAAFPSQTEFWVDHRIGVRVCDLVDATRAATVNLLNTDQQLRRSLDHLLAGLVRLGVAAAARLEQALAGL
jgi:hypothetical protein